MRRKAIALLLVLAMALAMCPMALAAGTSDVRTTNFFTDYNADIRTDLKFSDIEAKTYDMDELVATAKEALALMGDAANAAAVEEKVTEITDAYMMTLTWMNVAQVRAYQQYNSSDALWDIYYQNSDDNYELWDIACALIGEVLQSPCGGFLKEMFPDKADQDYYIDYAEWLDLANYVRSSDDGSTDSSTGDDPYTMNTNLQNEYFDKYYETYTATYNGREYTTDDVYAAEGNGTMDYDTGNALLREISRKQNEVLGAIYVEMLPYRAQIAADYGYSNYTENCYDYIYGYEYTPADIRAYQQALKTYIAPLYLSLEDAVNASNIYYSDTYLADYTGNKGMDLIEPYLGQMSSELLTSFEYMREHEMVDVAYSSSKYYSGGYTTYLYNYGTAYILGGANPSDGIYNFDTIVHEFGHYNADFYTGMGFYDDYKTTDICEVHSQGLELLMTHYYPEIFGDDGEDMFNYKMYGFLFDLLWDALLDEFEQYAYTTPGVTLQQLNEKYCSLEKEYGLIAADDPRTEMYGWVTVTHLFQTPGYVISYSTSLAGAFNFWLDAQNDFFPAVDDYLKFCALPGDLTFVESFEEIGMPNPLSTQYIKDLATKLEAAIAESMGIFTDLNTSAWYMDAVNFVVDNGLMNGVTSTKFDPNGTLNRAMLAQILYNLAGKPEVTESGLFTDVADSAWYADPINWAASEGIVTGYEDGTFQPTKSITRQELAVMLWRYEGSPESEGSLDSFKDANNVLAYAKDALVWAVANGVVNGYDNGTLQPKANSTRAVVAQMLMNLLADAEGEETENVDSSESEAPEAEVPEPEETVGEQ